MAHAEKLQLLYGEAEAIQKSRTTSLLWASKTLGTEYRLVHGVYVDCRDKDVCKHDVWEASIEDSLDSLAGSSAEKGSNMGRWEDTHSANSLAIQCRHGYLHMQ